MRPELHPACAAFPALPEEDLVALAADIRAKGLLEPITLTTDGLLLDGRCRWDACEREGIEPRTVVYDGDDPIGFVASKNRHRRHLSKSQMAMAIARLATLHVGSNQFKLKGEVRLSETDLSNKGLSKISGASVSYIGAARTVLKRGAPNVIAAVDDGKVVAHTAAEAVRKHDRATQAGWAVADIEKAGKDSLHAYPSNAIKQNHSAKSKPKPSKMIDPPYLHMEWPTKEELDYPKSGSSLKEYDAYFAKYGRTPLYPKAIKEMQDADALTSGLANVVRTLTHSHHPDAEQFFAYLDHLATHQREPDKTNGAQTDFAGKGRTTLAMLEAALPKALKLLHDLEAKLAAREKKTGEEAGPLIAWGGSGVAANGS
jgi:ParB-like chromosome segregation protein Spo0J